MNNGVTFLIGLSLGAIAGSGITAMILNKRHENDMNEFLTKVRRDYEEQMDSIVKNIHKEDPSEIRRKREELDAAEKKAMKEARDFLDKYRSHSADPEDPEDGSMFETWEEPEAPGPDENDPDALYPITESEMVAFVENGGDPEELLLSADGDLFMSRDFTEFDSPYIFDGVDIEGCFGKYNPDPNAAYFRDPVSNIYYRILKSMKNDEDMEECRLAQEGNE